METFVTKNRINVVISFIVSVLPTFFEGSHGRFFLTITESSMPDKSS